MNIDLAIERARRRIDREPPEPPRPTATAVLVALKPLPVDPAAPFWRWLVGRN